MLIENMNIFKANGFEFEVNEEDIKLKTIPISKNTVFGKSDIEELLHILNENSDVQGGIPRPSKVRAMFASRACRSSVMIGDDLNTKAMYKLIRQLSNLQHPWNCPHGRPTMRHLINMASLRSKLSAGN